VTDASIVSSSALVFSATQLLGYLKMVAPDLMVVWAVTRASLAVNPEPSQEQVSLLY